MRLAEPTAVGQTAPGLRLLALSLVLVVYGNLASLLIGGGVPAAGWPGVLVGLLLIAAMLLWAARVGHLGPRELGLQPHGLAGSAGWGLLVALATGLAAVLFLRFPPLLAGPVVYAPLSQASAATLLWRIEVWMPLDTVLPEELAFRGVLLASLMRRLPIVRAALASAGVFTLWHAVIVTRTLAQTILRSEPVFLALGFVGAFGAIFVGALLFATLRIRTRHLAGSMLAHWAFNSLLLVGLARS